MSRNTVTHDRRRIWREKVSPLLWLAVAGSILAVALGFSSDVNAAPAGSPGEQFAHDHAADVCIALDAQPNLPGVVAVLSGLINNGLSDMEAGVALGTSVTYVCPIHDPLMRQFVARYSKQAIR